MENRSVTELEILRIPQLAPGEMAQQRTLSDADVHSLMQFFELLDRWDREVVQ